jgi:CRP/FNR family transcriptional regulator, cyclic AMP receptor protein
MTRPVTRSAPRSTPDPITREFWEQLLPEETAELSRIGRRRDFRRAAVLFREAERSDSVMLLRSGRVKVSVDTANGTEVVLAVRGPGALLGEFSAIDRQPRSATVTAIEDDVSALALTLDEFEGFLRSHGRVAVLLMRTLVGKLRDADRKRIEFGAHDTTGRVAARLVEMAERFGQPAADGVRIALPFSQDELAGWICASREAVSKALGVLRSAGAIRTSRMSVVVRDIEALRRRSA